MIKITKIVEAMDMQMDTSSAFMDKKTEEIIFVSDDEFRIVDDEFVLEDYPEWQRETLLIAEKIAFDINSFISLPDKYEIHEYKIMEKFAININDERLFNALHGKGAFRRFKDQLHFQNLTDEYYDFYDRYLKEIAINWCEDNQP